MRPRETLHESRHMLIFGAYFNAGPVSHVRSGPCLVLDADTPGHYTSALQEIPMIL